MRYIIFGDIHGCHRAAKTAIELSENLGLDAIFLGDYVDRGPDSCGVLNELIKAKKRNKTWIFLKGNHELMLLNILDDPNLINTTAMLNNGGYYSYHETSKTYYSILKNNINIKEIRHFLQDLNLYYEISNYIFVHAPLRNNKILLVNKTEEELLWNYNIKPKWTKKTFIHGHDRVNKVEIIDFGININTSCGFGGYLTGLVVDAKKKVIISEYNISENGILINKILESN